MPLRAEIREQLSKGKNKREILAYFVDKYGEKILSSPTTTGFNLVAWVTPFALVSFGAVFIAAVLLRWSRQRAVPVAPHGGAEPGPQVPTAYEKILERELKDFEG